MISPSWDAGIESEQKESVKMLDDFREQANTSPFYEEEDDLYAKQRPEPPKYFLGMSPAQRFVVAMMILIIATVLSAFCLLVTNRVVLPLL